MPELSNLVDSAKQFKAISKRLEALNKKFPNEIKSIVSQYEGKALVWKGVYKSFNKDLSSKLMALKKVDPGEASVNKEISKISNVLDAYDDMLKAAVAKLGREGEFIDLPISSHCSDLRAHIRKIDPLLGEFTVSTNKANAHKKIKDWVSAWDGLKKTCDKTIEKDLADVKKGLIGNSKPILDLLVAYEKKSSGAQFSALKLLSGITPDKVSSRAREVRMHEEIHRLIYKHDDFVNPIVFKLETFFERSNGLYNSYVDVFDTLKTVCLDFKSNLDKMVDK